MKKVQKAWDTLFDASFSEYLQWLWQGEDYKFYLEFVKRLFVDSWYNFAALEITDSLRNEDRYSKVCIFFKYKKKNLCQPKKMP